MTDVFSNAKNSTLRRVRLKPSLPNSLMLYSASNCYLNSTPINNFVLPPPPCVAPSSCSSIAKPANRVLKPSLRKLGPLCSEANAIIKSVHFNEPLTRVVHFYTPPPLDEYDEDDEEETEEEEEGEEEEGKLEDAFLELYLTKSLQDECDSLAIADAPTTKNDGLSLPNWPLSTHPTRRFISQMVSLESIVWNHSLQVVQGRVLVHNLVFEKKVTARCSFDGWKTWIDVDAYHKEPAFNKLSESNSAFDRFMFELHVPENTHEFNCDIAIRYQTLGQEFWDNNNGNNFTIQSTPLRSKKSGEEPLSSFAAMMQVHGNSSNSNIKEGLSIISRLNFMEYDGKGSNQRQEKMKESCKHVHIVSQAKNTAKNRHSKYGASKIPAAPIPTRKRSTVQQHQNMDAPLIVVDLSQQQTGNSNDALISIMNTHDEAVDLKEKLYV